MYIINALNADAAHEINHIHYDPTISEYTVEQSKHKYHFTKVESKNKERIIISAYFRYLQEYHLKLSPKNIVK